MSIQNSDKALGVIIGLGVPALLALAFLNPAGLVQAAVLAIVFVSVIALASEMMPSHL